MANRKKYLKRELIASASYPTFRCTLTLWGRSLVKAVGHKIATTETEYFEHLAVKNNRSLHEVKAIANLLSPNGYFDFSVLPVWVNELTVSEAKQKIDDMSFILNERDCWPEAFEVWETFEA